jgi:pimeloyl-ACP methyl ester carboxylesterase
MKHTIKNRSGQKLVVLVEQARPQKGLAFVMHGLGGYKEQPHITAIAHAFSSQGFTVVRFDTTNSIGESDGLYEDATVTNYLHDLEDVIAWAMLQRWYEQRFWLAGHSLGGICTALYAERYPERVLALAPISTVVSGELSLGRQNRDWHEWKRTGWLIKKSQSRPEITKRLKWSHMEDRLKYDLLPQAKALTMPVLLIVGSEDESTLPEHQQLLFDAIPGSKEIHIVNGAPHTFREIKHLDQLSKLFTQWILKYT